MNNYINNVYGNKYDALDSANSYFANSDLFTKLKSQGGDNMNYNMCNYNGNANINNLFDVYNGFIRGNMFTDLYNKYKISKPFNVKPMNEQADLLTRVDAYCFALNDINLYLDTHPDDNEMIKLFNTLSSDLNVSTLEYEKKYGPIFVDSSKGYPWSWSESPWPWENI